MIAKGTLTERLLVSTPGAEEGLSQSGLQCEHRILGSTQALVCKATAPTERKRPHSAPRTSQN